MGYRPGQQFLSQGRCSGASAIALIWHPNGSRADWKFTNVGSKYLLLSLAPLLHIVLSARTVPVRAFAILDKGVRLLCGPRSRAILADLGRWLCVVRALLPWIMLASIGSLIMINWRSSRFSRRSEVHQCGFQWSTRRNLHHRSAPSREHERSQ